MTTLERAYTGLLAGMLAVAWPASAQVPSHRPGTICFTPQFWCHARYVGPVGAACSCRKPNGWVSGRLG